MSMVLSTRVNYTPKFYNKSSIVFSSVFITPALSLLIHHFIWLAFAWLHWDKVFMLATRNLRLYSVPLFQFMNAIRWCLFEQTKLIWLACIRISFYHIDF